VASYFPIQAEGGKPEGLGAVVVEITDRQRAQEGLQRSRHQLRALAARLQAVREEERARISREIHDELGQMLTGLKMDLRWMEDRLVQPLSPAEQGAITQKLREVKELTDATVSSIQRIAADLRPSVLDNLGLIVALGFEAKRFEERTGLHFAMTVPEESPPMDREVATGIFRIFQEALTNVARHAHATHIEIRLRTEGDALVLEVQDNGKGIAAEMLGAPSALGLLGMSERAASLGGHFDVQGAPGRGTTVTVRIPRVRRSGT
jgi:signal transduction histidine kinase